MDRENGSDLRTMTYPTSTNIYCSSSADTLHENEWFIKRLSTVNVKHLSGFADTTMELNVQPGFYI